MSRDIRCGIRLVGKSVGIVECVALRFYSVFCRIVGSNWNNYCCLAFVVPN